MKLLLSVIAGLLLTLSASSQTRVVHGELVTFNTFPVKNVKVTSKKAKSTITSDSLGQFTIVCYMKDVIQIKPKVFRPVKKRVGPDTDTLHINLIFIDTKPNRLLATGMGYVKEDELTYALSNLQDENNEFCNYNHIFDLIQGRLAGVQVVNNQVIIRGMTSINSSNEALYVVDGVITGSIDWIVPCNVRSINVLKDGMAAIYGARGSNGVVVIETKSGSD